MERDSQEIRLCALVLSVVAFFLFIAAEIVHEQRSAPSRGVLLLVAIGALAFAWIGPLTLLAGTLRSKKFQWWQPFQGGAEFVWMQAYGWCFHTFVLTSSVVVLANPQVPKWFEGQYLLLGAIGFMAQLLLNLSIGCFRDVADADTPTFQFPFTTKAVVSLLVSASGTLMFICYDLFSHRGQSPVMIALGCLEFLVSALVIHVLYGCAEIPGFRIWQPFEGERTFLLLQYLGWQLFAFTIGGALSIFFRAAASDDDSSYSSRGSGTAIGAMGMTSQILLLASLQYFDSSSSSCSSSSSIKDDPSQHHSSSSTTAGQSDATAGTAHSQSLGRRCKRWRHPAEVYVASLLCIGALGVDCLSYISSARPEVLPTQLLQFIRTHETVGWIISLSSLAIAAPIANMGGVRAKPSYCWWQPFKGGTKFVFLQTIGWLWYGFYLALAIVLCMNSASFGDFAACLVLVVGAGSAGAIATSLAYFEPSMALVPAVSQSAHWCDAIKGEVTMVMLLALASTVIHCSVDYVQSQLPPSIRAFCLVLAMALFVLASAISHWTGRKLHPDFRMWQPFEGGDRFVIRQAVGWALFGVQLLFDSLHLTLGPQTVPCGALSLLGAFALVPQLLLLSSIQYFEPTQCPERFDATIESPSTHAQCCSWTALLQDTSVRWHAWSNVLIIVGSTSLFVSAEVLSMAGSSSYQRAEDVLYLFGCLLSTCGIAFTHGVLGPKVHPTYRVIQPFRGGIQFITFHGAAWTLVAVAWVLSTTVIYWSAMFFEIPGIHVLTGLLYTAAQSILLYAIPLFKPSSVDDQRGGKRQRQGGALDPSQSLKAEDMANQFFVGRLLGFSACAVFVLVDLAMVRWGPTIPVFPMTVSAVLALFSSIPLSYKFASSTYGTKAKTISGSIVFVVLGCALWSFTLLLGGLFSYNLWRTQDISLSVSSVHAPTKYLGSFTGSVGFTAQLLFVQASEPAKLKVRDLGLTLPRDKTIRAIVATVTKHVAIKPIWVYSAVPLIAGLLYAHTKSVLPTHLATSQILVLALCSAAVISSAWWIQQQIFSTGCVCVPLSGSTSLTKRHLPLRPLAEPLAQRIAVLDVGVDSYAHIAAFLTVSDLIVLSSTTRALYAFHSEDVWRQVFADRFFASACVTKANDRSSRSSPNSSSSSGGFAISTGAHPFAATTLNHVETALVNLICRQQQLPSASLPSKRATVTMRSKWKAFCLGGERKYAFEQCRVCDEIDAVSDSLLQFERRENCRVRAPSTWVALCECVNPVTLRTEKAHRACLETKLHVHRHAGNSVDSQSQQHHHQSTLFDACPVCAIGVTEGGRLPQTLWELVRVTYDDFCTSSGDFGGGFFVLVPASASMFIFALQRVGWGSCAMYTWVLIVVALCFIINSPRFDRCLARLGRPDSPSFVAYQRAYHALALSSIMHLSWCCPSMNTFEAAPSSTLMQVAVKLAFRCNCAFFIAVSAAACLAFWRTQYRIVTVYEARAAAAASVPPAAAETANRQHQTPRAGAASTDTLQDDSCVLCLLKLCGDSVE